MYLREAKRQGRVTIAHSHSQKFPLSVTELGFRALAYPVRRVADNFIACSMEAGLIGSERPSSRASGSIC